jgi:hypothetical protein
LRDGAFNNVCGGALDAVCGLEPSIACAARYSLPVVYEDALYGASMPSMTCVEIEVFPVF